jgi:hypothetical protein
MNPTNGALETSAAPFAGYAQRWADRGRGIMRLLSAIGVALLASSSAARAQEQITFTLQHGVSVRFTTAPFEESAHKVVRCKVLDWSGVCLIDGRPAFGTDWELPKTSVQSGMVTVGKRDVALDVSCMYNPMLSESSKRLFRVRQVEGGYVLSGYFSDGAGGYRAEWLIVADGSVRTALRNAEH